eukprot:Gb_10922 [translate_table: standard]
MQGRVLPVITMAIAHPLRDRSKKKNVPLFFGLMLQLQSRKNTIHTMTGSLRTEGNARNTFAEAMRIFCKKGQLNEALHILEALEQSVDTSTYVYLLQVCIKKKALSEGKLVHGLMSERGFMPDTLLLNTLVNMYVKCGSLVNARRVFDEMPKRDVCSWTVMLAAYSRHGLAKEALTLFHQMPRTEIQPNQFTFASVLPACANTEALEQGVEIHEEIIKSGFQSDGFVGNALVDMYAKCGSIEEARDVFDKMRKRDVVSWTAMIAGYVLNGQSVEALKFFQQMRLAGVKPNPKTFAIIFPACADLAAVEQGMEIHAEIIRTGFKFDVFMENALVDMYAKCGNIGEARELFDKMPQRNSVSWNTMIAGYAQNGYVDEAMKLFQKMPKPDVVSWTAMIAGYTQNGCVDDALKLFQEMPERNAVSWTAMIAGCAQNGQGMEALKLFQQMQLAGVKPDSKTFASVLQACANLAALEQGMEIHEEIIRSGFQSNVFVENALVNLYAKCGSIEKARRLFDKMHRPDVVSWNTMIAGYAQHGHVNEALFLFQKMPEPDVVSWNAMIAGYTQNGYVGEALKLFQKMPKPDAISWNAMIAGYAQNGHGEEALEFFRQMQLAGVKPDSKTFASVFPACANLAALKRGMEIHEEIIRSGFQINVLVENALVDMYAKCGGIGKARNIFDKMSLKNVVSWNTMIAGYAQNGHVNEALELFQKMPKPDVVSWTAMIAGYTQNGHVDEALKLFQQMPEPNVVSWTTIVAGYAQNGQSVEALDLFRQMQLAGVKPDPKAFASVLPACANLAALEQGIEIHEEIIRSGFHSDILLVNAVLDMYAKCGNIHKARNLFDNMHQRNSVSWTTMIAGYAMHGCGKEALKLFEQMLHSGMIPDHVTLLCVLSACCHAGLVDEGLSYFDCMIQYYCITPAMEHYGCIVDLLGRAGRLDEAQNFINKMPIKPDATVWKSLLSACKTHNNIELGECAAEHLFELDPKNATPYVLLSNIYAAAGRWDDSENVRRMMKDRKVKKNPGCSWIEVNKQVHTFLIGDRSHPQNAQNLCKVGDIF